MALIYFASIVFASCIAGIVYLSFVVNKDGYVLDEVKLRRAGKGMVLLVIAAMIALIYPIFDTLRILT